MKNNKGISIISFILTILILILIIFLGYEIFYIDILDIMGENNISKEENIENRIIITGKQNQEYSNTSSVSPIIDDNNLRERRKCIY